MPIGVRFSFIAIFVALVFLAWRIVYHARQAKLWRGYLRERHVHSHRTAAWALCIFVGIIFLLVPWKIVPLIQVAAKKSPPALLITGHIIFVVSAIACLAGALTMNGLSSKRHAALGWTALSLVGGVAITGIALYYFCR